MRRRGFATDRAARPRAARARPLLAAAGVLLLIQSAPPIAAQPVALEGMISVAWGDPSPEIGGAAHLAFHLTEDDGAVTAIAISPELVALFGGPDRLRGGRFRVELKAAPPGAAPAGDGPAAVSTLELADAPAGPVEQAAVLGSKPWISILCKFTNIADEPENLAFFQGMYANAPGRLDHYWREVSYDAIDIVGSTAVDWVDLPHPQSHYMSNPGSGQDSDKTALFNDCTAAADAAGVDFSNGGTGGFEGINMMFNGLLDCCAWGGNRWATLDGVFKSWRVTWEPPWGYAHEGVMGHEMGHGFGLPHSNNSDLDGSPYDSPWDVMSAATGYAVLDPTYGRLGKHTIAYHKNVLGWIQAAERFEVTLPGVYPITLDHLALPSTANYRMATVVFGGTSYYVVEARERVGSYEANLAGNAVLIFDVDPSRGEDAWVVDADVPPADYSDNEGSMWKVGEVFEDVANQVQISVDGAAPNGFDVTISYGVPPVLTTSPPAADFGDVAVGDSTSIELQLVNSSSGPQTALVWSMVLSETQSFSLDVNGGVAPCGGTSPVIPPSSFCTVTLGFAPVAEAVFAEDLSITSNASALPLVVPIAAEGTACAFVEHLVLPEETVTDTRTESACATITAGPYTVNSPGDVTLQAGERIILDNGFTVGAGGRLTVEEF